MSNDECGNKSKNYRNGYSKKTIKTQMGELEIKVPRDRNGEYEPKIISKYNRNADIRYADLHRYQDRNGVNSLLDKA